MKRLDARTLRYQLHRLFVTTMLAVAALSLLAEMAHAQSGILCGDPGEQPDLLLSVYLGNLDVYFPVENATCEKLVRGATASCHKVVSDAVACREHAENLDAGIRSSIEEEAALGHYRCEQDFAPELFGYCVGDPV